MKQTLLLLHALRAFLLLCAPLPLAAQLRLNEIAPSNADLLADEDGDFPDWLELYNAGNQAVQTGQFYLSDAAGQPLRWRLPDVVLPPGARRLIFASGKNRIVAGTNWHTNFKLKKGETLWLRSASGVVVDSLTIAGDLQYGHTQARIPDGAGWCVTDQPSPGSSNNGAPCYPGYAADPVFSKPGGFYPSAVQVTLSCPTPGAKVRYNLFGKSPTASDPAYGNSGPLHLNTGVQPLRARAFAPGYLPSRVVTHTYAVGEHSTLPVVFMTTDPDNLFDYFTGIYELGPGADPSFPYFGANFWQDWTRPATIEYFPSMQAPGFTQDIGIEIHGNWMKACEQKSFDLKAADRYGEDEFNYPLFSTKPWIDRFDKFVLRNAGNDNNYAHIRDGIIQTLGAATHADHVANGLALLFINGTYWGLYQLYEANDEYFPQNNGGLKKDNLDLVRYLDGHTQPQAGTIDDWKAFMDFVQTHPLASPANYDTLRNRYLDVDNFADYIFTGVYCGNWDWITGNNNVKAWHRRQPYGPWRYILWDNDFSFGQGTFDLLGDLTDPVAANEHEALFRRLLDNPSFRRFFINRSCDLLNTAFLPQAVEQIRDKIAARMNPEMPRHFQRWTSSCFFGPGPATYDDWLYRAYGEINEQAEKRPQQLWTQYINHFNLVKKVGVTLRVEPPGAGHVRISTIVPDQYPWSGVYLNGNPVTVTALPEPGYSFVNWSPNAYVADTSQTGFTADIATNTTFTAHFTSATTAVQPPDSERIIVNPNPSSGYFQIFTPGLSPLHWRVLDALGHGILEGVPETGQEIWSVQLPETPAGMYLLVVQTSTGYWSRRLIIR